MDHAVYIAASYAITALVILCLIAWVWLDGRSRRKEMAVLDAAGIRRRSARPVGDENP